MQRPLRSPATSQGLAIMSSTLAKIAEIEAEVMGTAGASLSLGVFFLR